MAGPRPFDRALDAYLAHLRVERGLSAHTLDAYARDLGTLRAFVDAEAIGLDELDTAAMSGWLLTLSRKGLSARSQARHLSAARGLFRWLLDERILRVDPTAKIDAPKLLAKIPSVLGRGDVAALLSMPDRAIRRGRRDAAMLHTLYAAGLRVSELCCLPMSDVNLDAGYLTAFGKGDKRRLVPLGVPARKRIEAWLRTGRRGRSRTSRRSS